VATTSPSAGELDSRQRQDLVVPRQGSDAARPGILAVDGGEKAHLAEVDAEHRHAGTGVRPQRVEDGSVTAEREADVDLGVEPRVELHEWILRQPMLG